MTDIQLTLFDAEALEAPPRTEPIGHSHAELPVEPHAEPWVLIRDSRGVMPHFHLIVERAGSGAVATACGRIGTQLGNDGVTQMIRCPECDVSAQLRSLREFS